MGRTTFRLARNPYSGEFEWAAKEESGLEAWAGWLIMAMSTLLFLLVTAYIVYWLVLSAPHFDPNSAPDITPAGMREEVQQLRGIERR
jgi:hypothetical protein